MFKVYEFPNSLPLRPKFLGERETFTEARDIVRAHVDKALGEGAHLAETEDAKDNGWDYLAYVPGGLACLQFSIETAF